MKEEYYIAENSNEFFPEERGNPYYYSRPDIRGYFAKQTVRISIALIILAIISMIFYTIVPWVSIEHTNDSGFNYQVTFNENMELTSKNVNTWGGNELRHGDVGLFGSLEQKYYIDTIDHCFFALILTLILAFALLITGFINISEQFQMRYHIANILLGVFLLISGLLVTIPCSRFIGNAIRFNHTYIDNSTKIQFLSPAGFFIFIFGFLIVSLSFLIIRGEIHEIKKLRQKYLKLGYI